MDVETFIDDEGILTEPRQKMQREVSAKYGRRQERNRSKPLKRKRLQATASPQDLQPDLKVRLPPSPEVETPSDPFKASLLH
jgi:hypothetical protein